MFESLAGNILQHSAHGDNGQLLLVSHNGTQRVIARGDARGIETKHKQAVLDLAGILEKFVGGLSEADAAPAFHEGAVSPI